MKEPIILLVDDEIEFLEAIRLGLDEKGYKVLTAQNGSEGLALLEKHTPEVIIADLRMQPMNGFEFYQRVKKIVQYKDTPFFFLTGMKDELAEKYGLTLGAAQYFVKPVELEVLEAAIKEAVTKK
ncbi:MAG: response regulator [Bacteroidota bacterium]